MEAIFVVGALVIGSVILTLVIVVFSDDTAARLRLPTSIRVSS